MLSIWLGVVTMIFQNFKYLVVKNKLSTTKLIFLHSQESGACVLEKTFKCWYYTYFHVFSCIFSFLLLLFSCLTVCDKNNVKTMQKVTVGMYLVLSCFKNAQLYSNFFTFLINQTNILLITNFFWLVLYLCFLLM